VNRNAAFGVGALLGAAAAIVWDRRSRHRVAPGPAPEARQRELREKLAGAQQTETPAPTAGSPPPAAEPPKPPDPAPPPPPRPAQPQASEPKERPAPPPGPPPADEFEAMRRRIHQEGKAAAEEMRRAPDEDS
jgi:hypothetical protein